MAKKTTWLKLFCSLSGLSVIPSSCFNPESFFSFKNESDTIKLSNITSNDLTVSDKLTHNDLLASNITSSNFSQYFELKLVQKADEQQDLNNLVDIKVGGFSADDSNGILSFIVTLEKKNSNPVEFKQVSLEINGFLKKQEPVSQPKNDTDNVKKPENSNNDESTDTTPPPTSDEPSTDQEKNPNSSDESSTDQQKTPNSDESTTDQSSSPTTVDETKKPEPSSSETKLRVFSDQEIYKKIYDRTFSLEFYTRYTRKNSSNSNIEQLYYLNNGTGWLLDYQVSPENPDLYRLFLATNLHVAQTLWNKNDFDRPVTDLESAPETIGFSLGKSDQVEFSAQNSSLNNSVVKYATLLDNTAFYNRVPNRANSWRVSSQRLTIPQTVFAAVDFVNDQQTTQELSSYWANQFKTQFVNNRLDDKNLLEHTYPKDAESRTKIADKYLEQGIGLYKDFAVLSVIVNLSPKMLANESAQRYNASRLLRKYVLEAIHELNESSRLAKLPGQLNLTNLDLPYVDLDYPSIEQNQPNAYSFEEINKAYIAGYPGVENSSNASRVNFRWVQNNLNKDPNYQLKPNINSGLVNKTQDITGLIQYYHNKYYHQYGITQEVLRSSLRSGSSGSVVYSKYGLPFGIFWGGYNGGDPQQEENNRGLFDYLANDTKKSLNINVRYSNPNRASRFKINIEPYNLIDGTNKQKYPNQTNSYREALAKYLVWSQNNNFSNSTYLFSHP